MRQLIVLTAYPGYEGSGIPKVMTIAEAKRAAKKLAAKYPGTTKVVAEDISGNKLFTLEIKTANPTKSKSLASKLFIPVQVIGDTLVARVTNPSQKRAFKGLVSKIKRSLK